MRKLETATVTTTTKMLTISEDEFMKVLSSIVAELIHAMDVDDEADKALLHFAFAAMCAEVHSKLFDEEA